MSARALRIAIEAASLPLDETDMLMDALIGLDGRFARAVDGLTDAAFAAMSCRPLSEIVTDLENGVPLPPDEAALIGRLHANLPVASDRERRARGEKLIRDIVHQFGPRTSVNGKVKWLSSQFDMFVGGPDWRGSAQYDSSCPYADPTRAQLWYLAKLLGGKLPRARTLHDILAR